MTHNIGSCWWCEGVSFTCLGCGRCCRGEPGAIWVQPSEVRSIMEFLGISSEPGFQKKYMTQKWKRPSLAEKRNGECVFYTGDTNKCSIYSVRPVQCSLYPFWPSMFVSREIWDRHALFCPGMNQGRFYCAEEIASILSLSPFDDL